MSTPDIKAIAKQYIDKGWQVVPINPGQKAASGRWRQHVYKVEDFGPDDGIAVKCGEPSGWLVDVDLDCPQAVECAKDLLPPTMLIHGRLGKAYSHYWFICRDICSKAFSDIKSAGSKTLVELRSTGGYTVLPPSVHPSGEQIVWEIERDAMVIDAPLLLVCVRNVAIAALIVRHYPGPGGRHAAIGHLAGFLLRAGVHPDDVQHIIMTAARVAGDPDLHDRQNIVKSTIAKFASEGSDAKITAGRKLAEEMGAEFVAKLRSWLGTADMDAIEEMNERHFQVALGKDAVIGREDRPSGIVFQQPKALYVEYANRQVVVGEKVAKDGSTTQVLKPLFQAWLESPHRRTYREVVFDPPPFESDPLDYNLWKGFAIDPAPGDWSLFQRHLLEVICSNVIEHYNYLLNLLALTFQQPGVPSEIAVVLRGEPGTGKGTFVRVLQRIFGRHHFAHLDRIDDLTGFNAMISGKIIVFADEAVWGGDKKSVSTLKRLITEPTIRVTRKGIDSHEERNCMHLFLATNEDWSVPTQKRERRFLALKVSNQHREDHAYFTALEKELDNGGAAAFLHDLLKMPIDRAALRNVPRTRELRVQQTKSMPPHERCVQDWLYAGRVGDLKPTWGEDVFTIDVYKQYVTYMDQNHGDKHKLDYEEFGRDFAQVLYAGKTRSKRRHGETERAATFKSLAEARKAFDELVGTEGAWPAEDEEQLAIPAL